MAQPLKKEPIIALFGEVAGTKLINWLNPCCTTLCEYINECVPSVGLLHARITLTAKQIQALNSSPIVIVPAPGAGKVIIPVSITQRLNFNSAAYTGGTTLRYKEGTVAITVEPNVLLATNNTISILPLNSNVITTATTPSIINAGLIVDTASAALTGDSSIDIYVTYEILTL